MNSVLASESIGTSVQARHIQTPIEAAEWADARESSSDVAKRLVSMGYDQAPVRRAGRLVGYVETSVLLRSDGRVGAVTRALDATSFASAHASVAEVIQALLPDRLVTFLVDGHRVAGFVTPSDLNKHAARVHYYLLLADLEIILADRLSAEFDDFGPVVEFLSPSERGKVDSRHRRDAKNNVHTSYSSSMDLSHLLTGAQASPSLSVDLEIGTAESWPDLVQELARFRNAVMHPTVEFLGAGRSLFDIVRMESLIRRMLSRLMTTAPPTVRSADDLAPSAVPPELSGGLPLTLAQVAKALGLSPVTLRSAIQRGALSARKHGRDWLVDPSEAANYLLHHRGRVGWPKGRSRAARRNP